MPKATVIVFPGSNCNEEAFEVLKTIGFDVSYTWHTESLPTNLDFCFLPGGFSYGDRLRSGAIASFSNILREIKNFANKGGYVMGVCNGFQILTESKILEGALLRNGGSSFICKNIEVDVVDSSTVFTKNISKTLTMQIAHADGRYFCHDDTIKKLQDEQKIAFTYKENPNGSINNIAGIFGGKNNNILGMMPHPERDIISGTNGIEIFQSLFKGIQCI
jgi:phosphoribosylformylglycinamidine synthase subunit PurQ / glutaminase